MSEVAVLIADMVRAGVDPDLIGRTADALARREAVLVPDEAADRRTKAGALERWGYAGSVLPRLSDRDWWALKYAILERDGYECRYCGAKGADSTIWTADHVVPLSRGGSNDAANLVACCVPCNSSKSDRLLSEWKGRAHAG